MAFKHEYDERANAVSLGNMREFATMSGKGPTAGPESGTQFWPTPELGPAAGGTPADRRDIEYWLVVKIAQSQEVDPEQIDVGESFVANGLTSAASVALVGELARTLGVTLPETLCWEYPSIAALAEHVAGVGPGPHDA
jgi:acyl carrier protein